MTDFTLNRRGLFGLAAGVTTLPLLASTSALADGHSAAAPVVTVYNRAVGDTEIVTALDGFFNLGQELVTNLDEAKLKAAMKAAYLGTDGPIPLAISVHIIKTGGRTILADAGAGTAFGPNSGKLGSILAALGIAPDQITDVILTHMHPDHIGGLMGDTGAAFPKAKIHVAKADFDFWTSEEIAGQAPDNAKPFFALARSVRDAYGERLTMFEGETDLGNGVSSLPAPGHTAGHTAYRVSSGDDQLLIWGDSTAVAAYQFMHPEAGIAFDADGAQAAETRRKLFDMASADRVLVAGTHLPFPGFGHVEKTGEAYAWLPEEWRYQ